MEWDIDCQVGQDGGEYRSEIYQECRIRLSRSGEWNGLQLIDRNVSNYYYYYYYYYYFRLEMSQYIFIETNIYCRRLKMAMIRMKELFPLLSRGKKGIIQSSISFINEYFKTSGQLVDIIAPTCTDFYNLCRDIIISRSIIFVPRLSLRSNSRPLCIKLFEIIARVSRTPS